MKHAQGKILLIIFDIIWKTAPTSHCHITTRAIKSPIFVSFEQQLQETAQTRQQRLLIPAVYCVVKSAASTVCPTNSPLPGDFAVCRALVFTLEGEIKEENTCAMLKQWTARL